MVERIVSAGAHVLRAEGYENFSTNRVARAADVSPGSLYQYFPDKAAIVDEVIDRWNAEVSDRVAAALAERVGEEGPDMIRGVVEALVAALEADTPLLRIVLVELPPARTRSSLLSLEQRVRELLATYLTVRTPGAAADHAVRAWVAVMAVEHLVVRWILDEPAISRERLIEEVVGLGSRYLAGDLDHGAPPGSRHTRPDKGLQ